MSSWLWHFDTDKQFKGQWLLNCSPVALSMCRSMYTRFWLHPKLVYYFKICGIQSATDYLHSCKPWSFGNDMVSGECGSVFANFDEEEQVLFFVHYLNICPIHKEQNHVQEVPPLIGGTFNIGSRSYIWWSSIQYIVTIHYTSAATEYEFDKAMKVICTWPQLVGEPAELQTERNSSC